MDDYDPQREAEAAMKLAISTDGADRQRLIWLAMVWRELARAGADGTPKRGIGRA